MLAFTLILEDVTLHGKRDETSGFWNVTHSDNVGGTQDDQSYTDEQMGAVLGLSVGGDQQTYSKHLYSVATANPAPPAPDVAAVLAEADMYCENHNGMTSDLISTLRDALARVAKERDAAIAKYNNLFEVWPESLGWCEHEHRYHYKIEDGDENPDSCMQCERDEALARAEKAESAVEMLGPELRPFP